MWNSNEGERFEVFQNGQRHVEPTDIKIGSDDFSENAFKRQPFDLKKTRTSSCFL